MRLLIPLLLLVGCSRPMPAPSPAPSVAPSPSPSPETVPREGFLDVMHERLLALDDMEFALLRADVPGVKAAASRVQIDQLRHDLPAVWQPRVDALGAALTAVSASADLDQASRAMASTVSACGACHEAADADLRFSRPDHPRRDEGTPAHMARHREAAALMREAIVSADPVRWTAAMTWLAQAPLEDEELPPAYTMDEAARSLEARTHALAAEGQEAADAPARARVYGQVLLTCASCHAHTGGGPKP